LRGSHAGSFEAFHSMRAEAFWKNAPTPEDTGEEYDLVVVGGGISGLTAAHVFRKARQTRACWCSTTTTISADTPSETNSRTAAHLHRLRRYPVD
jgi:hypothetical protein